MIVLCLSCWRTIASSCRLSLLFHHLPFVFYDLDLRLNTRRMAHISRTRKRSEQLHNLRTQKSNIDTRATTATTNSESISADPPINSLTAPPAIHEAQQTPKPAAARILSFQDHPFSKGLVRKQDSLSRHKKKHHLIQRRKTAEEMTKLIDSLSRGEDGRCQCSCSAVGAMCQCSCTADHGSEPIVPAVPIVDVATMAARSTIVHGQLGTAGVLGMRTSDRVRGEVDGYMGISPVLALMVVVFLVSFFVVKICSLGWRRFRGFAGPESMPPDVAVRNRRKSDLARSRSKDFESAEGESTAVARAIRRFRVVRNDSWRALL